MTFKPAIWQPIAVVLSAINLAAVGFAVGEREPLHATVHAAVALALGLWAQRLGRGRSGSAGELSEVESRLEALEIDLGNLRRELGETQERLDFTERVLAQQSDSRRLGPES
jgi:hypothetical protein